MRSARCGAGRVAIPDIVSYAEGIGNRFPRDGGICTLITTPCGGAEGCMG